MPITLKLLALGSYESTKASERDYLICDENGYAVTKNLPYGIYTVHQTKSWDGRELLADFDVYIAKDGQTYRYLANNRNFESYIKIVKVDAETSKVIPLTGAGFRLYRPDGSLITQTFTYPEVTTIDTFYTSSDDVQNTHNNYNDKPLTPFIRAATAILLRPKSWNTARAIRWSRFPLPTAIR